MIKLVKTENQFVSAHQNIDAILQAWTQNSKCNIF